MDIAEARKILFVSNHLETYSLQNLRAFHGIQQRDPSASSRSRQSRD